MPGIEGDREIGTATFLVGGIDHAIDAPLEVRAHRRHHVSARGKAEDSDFVRIDVPLRGVKANEADGSLCVFQRYR